MKRILILAAALFTACTAFAQSEYNLQRRSLFEVLPVYSSDIVFLGNSITDGCEWAELFNNRHVKNRGISGDRSGWLLDRLDPIVGGHPKKLFLMIGVNDLAAGVSPDEIVANVAGSSTVSSPSRAGRRSMCRASCPSMASLSPSSGTTTSTAVRSCR